MIGGCINSGKYNMSADLYKKIPVRNENTGQIKYQYSVSESNFPLVARGLANLRGKDSGTMQDYGNILNEYHYLRVKTLQVMEEGDLIIRITDSNGKFYKDSSIQFVVLGVTPTFDPFGSFMEYDIICNKADVPVKILDNDISGSDSSQVAGIDG